MGIVRCFKLHYWPILTSVWFSVSLLITFGISILNKHVYVLFPYISDTGTTPPESCIFGQLLSIGAVLLAITIYIRYQQINLMLNTYQVSLNKKWNKASLWCGLLVVLGISVVANFQETLIYPVHLLGAFMTFGIGTLYLFVQTVICYSFRTIYYENPKYGVGMKIIYLRTILVACCGVFFIITTISLFLALSQFTGDNMAWWTEEHGAFEIRLVSTFSEWILASFFTMYILTTTSEYKVMEFDGIRFKDKENNDCNIAEKIYLNV